IDLAALPLDDGPTYAMLQKGDAGGVFQFESQGMRDVLRAILGFSGGAEPLPENYRNWNLTYEGLLITFDEYQVAPYAAGMQQVLVPFDVLENYFAESFSNLAP
ncbi:MAG: DUF3298 domain-containing protein, partial [Anaerolineales bacterium]